MNGPRSWKSVFLIWGLRVGFRVEGCLECRVFCLELTSGGLVLIGLESPMISGLGVKVYRNCIGFGAQASRLKD